MTGAECVCIYPGVGGGSRRLPAETFHVVPYRTTGLQPDRTREPAGCTTGDGNSKSTRAHEKARDIQRTARVAYKNTIYPRKWAQY